MKNEIYLIGEVGYDVTLQSVVDLVGNTDENEPLTIHIHSPGGSVYDGLAIYNYLKGLDREIHTKSVGLIASIASVFFLVGKTRAINESDKFLIHLPMGGEWGNAEDLERTAEELRDIEDRLATIYELETNLSKDEALELMNKDEFLGLDFLQEKGFINEIIKFKAVATLNKNKMSNTGVTKQEVEGIFAKFFKKHFGKKEIQAKIVTDASGTEIDFFDLESNDSPKVGDKATVDGEKADGDFLMPNEDTLRFVSGELKEIIEAEESDEESDEDAEAVLKEKVENLEQELESKETEITNSEEEITELKETISNMKKDFKKLKAQVSGRFDYKAKKKHKKEDETAPKTRKLYKQD
jgi:ATP-dependent Clp protease protease subunit